MTRDTQFEFNLGEGRAARDQGMDQVANNNQKWMLAAFEAIRRLPIGWRGLPEEVWVSVIAPMPTSPNIKGSVSREAAKLGLWRKTGVRLQMRKRSSHARMTDEYIRIGNG